MPLVQLAKAAAKIGNDESIRIIGDDPIFEIGVREFCQARGFVIESTQTEGREVTIELRPAQPDEGS